MSVNSFFSYISKFEIPKVITILTEMDEVQDQAIPKLLDERGLNLINRACADNSYSLASFVIKFVRDR